LDENQYSDELRDGIDQQAENNHKYGTGDEKYEECDSNDGTRRRRFRLEHMGQRGILRRTEAQARGKQKARDQTPLPATLLPIPWTKARLCTRCLAILPFQSGRSLGSSDFRIHLICCLLQKPVAHLVHSDEAFQMAVGLACDNRNPLQPMFKHGSCSNQTRLL
jgi:hypothetical protein